MGCGREGGLRYRGQGEIQVLQGQKAGSESDKDAEADDFEYRYGGSEPERGGTGY